MHPSFLALAVVTTAVGALDDASGAAGALLVAAEGLTLLEVQGEDEDGSENNEDGELHF